MYSENCFKGKLVIVTGAGRGIGRALSLRLCSLGAKVYAVSKNPANLTSIKIECPSIETICVDLANWELTKQVLNQIEPVHCLVNNAGICNAGEFMDIEPQLFDAHCDINLKAVINVSQIVVKKMIEAGHPGSIVNISSVAGLKALPFVSVYSVLKAGLDQLTKIMAIVLGPHNIRVNSINPGTVLTDLAIDVGKSVQGKVNKVMQSYTTQNALGVHAIEMDHVVNNILFYLSDLAPTNTGNLVPLDGGFCI